MKLRTLLSTLPRLVAASAVLYVWSTSTDAHDNDCHLCNYISGVGPVCVHDTPTGQAECFATPQGCWLHGAWCS